MQTMRSSSLSPSTTTTLVVVALTLLLQIQSIAGDEGNDFAGTTTRVIQDTPISYVIEPFESSSIGKDSSSSWFQDSTFDLRLSNDAAYGQHALSIVEIGEDSSTTTSSITTTKSFGWIDPERPHNCWGAEHFSFWIKTPALQSAGQEGEESMLKFSVFDDSNCTLTSNDCSQEENLDSFVIADIGQQQENGEDAEDTWREIKVETAVFPDLDLQRLRGWKVEITGSLKVEADAAEPILLLDHLACLGGGAMFGAALHIATPTTTFEDSVAEGTWREAYHQSETARAASNVVLESGKIDINYTIERVEDWGGYTSFYVFAPGNGYYNLSDATDIVIDYDVTQVASLPRHSTFRFLLFDSSNCTQDCDIEANQGERWYSFHEILDQVSLGGQLVIPLIGSIKPTTPFWLPGWAGNEGNSQLDVDHIKGFYMEFALDERTPPGSLVSGSVSFQNIGAAISPDFVDAEISYVIDGFESTSYTYENHIIVPTGADGGEITLSESDDALFGKKSLLVEYNNAVGYFESILPLSRAHHCHGAQYLSLWYKSLGPGHFRLSLLDDSGGGASCTSSSPERQDCPDVEETVLKSTVMVDQVLDAAMDDWQEIQVYDFGSLDLRRVKGWRIEMDQPARSFLLDQLAFVGDGSLFGAAFYPGVETFQEALEEESWTDVFYNSEISNNNTVAVLQNGQFNVDYTLQQIETWGGFLSYHHDAPGVAYYNVSQATNLIFSYNIGRVSSSPGRALLRVLLADNSDCILNCATDTGEVERWYSFHQILDDAGNGNAVTPLVGSTEPTTPFWQTGWSGITGNAQLDLAHIKGFAFEFNVDGELGVGNSLSGSIKLHDFAVSSDIQKGPEAAYLESCFVEADVHFIESAPQFTKVPFLGAQCCEICATDPDCLYAFTNGFGNCFIAPYLDPNYVRLLNNKNQQTTMTSIWMDDQSKRGDFCDRCECREDSETIDCTGQDLAILPKSFGQSWSPKILDLTGNPRLVLLGSGSLSSIGDSLEEIRLPTNIKHIAPKALEDLPMLNTIQFEGDDDINNSVVQNMITDSTGFFFDVCCGRGSTIELGSQEEELTFCNMQISVPGVDAVYEDFLKYLDAPNLAVITPSADFMAEAAESPEKCAEFCAISLGCRFFNYDGRVKNAEHICLLKTGEGTVPPERVCCEEDHYADDEQTQPGWVLGRPPRTRHELDDAKVLYSVQEVQASEDNGYETEFEVFLGSTPVRGAVWVEPTLASTSMDFDVTISPSRLVLYDDSQSATVTIKVNNILPGSPSATLVVQNTVTSCDTAFMVSGTSSENAIYVYLTSPEAEDGVNLDLAIALSTLSTFLLIGCGLLFVSELKRRQNDNVWRVKTEELKFADPPEIVGRGTFGVVLLGEYRGTKVAVKRVLPPEMKKKNRHNGNESIASYSSSGESMSKNTLESSEPAIGDKLVSVGTASGGATKSMPRTASVLITRTDFGIRRQLRAEFFKEMKQFSVLRHPCITTVMGAVMDSADPMLVMEYMELGSLYDILHNETMRLDGEILLPILCDITQGLRFLHSADPQIVHCDLKAQNILVDSRFRAKVADFGLSQKKTRHGGGQGTPYWMAPELLRGQSVNTAESDVYSFGIILYEVYSRREPYEGEDFSEVLPEIMDETIRKRPPIPSNCPPAIQTMMSECIRDDAWKRPTFEELDVRLKREEVDSVDPGNQQANGKASHISLFDIFPRHIAEALQDGRTVEPEHRDMVTIFFSDIVGFTNISSELPPRKVANMLDRLYTKLDALSQEYDVFKVETIGDAYMAVTNLVKDQSRDHAKRVAEFAIRAVQAANETMIDEDNPKPEFVNLRVGMHCGSVVADVVGTRNPRYCLFGDTVNTASRMESSSKINRIHCSSQAAEILLQQYPEMPLKSRGVIPIKGKGDMHTFWVNEQGVTRPQLKKHTSAAERSMIAWARIRAASTDASLLFPVADDSSSADDPSHEMQGDVEMPLDVVMPLNDL